MKIEQNAGNTNGYLLRLYEAGHVAYDLRAIWKQKNGEDPIDQLLESLRIKAPHLSPLSDKARWESVMAILSIIFAFIMVIGIELKNRDIGLILITLGCIVFFYTALASMIASIERLVASSRVKQKLRDENSFMKVMKTVAEVIGQSVNDLFRYDQSARHDMAAKSFYKLAVSVRAADAIYENSKTKDTDLASKAEKRKHYREKYDAAHLALRMLGILVVDHGSYLQQIPAEDIEKRVKEML